MSNTSSTSALDVLVLGAGILGVSTALHLQQRGLRVGLIDKHAPGQGTSFGNAGLIERASVIPYAFPHSPASLLRYAGNRQPDVRFQWKALPALAPWLYRYWKESSPKRLAFAANDMLPLIERCITEHAPFIRDSNQQHRISEKGWIDIYRDQQAFASAAVQAKHLSQQYGLQVQILNATALRISEPALATTHNLVGGIHWLDPWTVSAPGALVQGYAELFTQRGGSFIQDHVHALAQQDSVWTATTTQGAISAKQVVIALGPDATPLCQSLGYRIPLVQKRGYHLHFTPSDDTPAPEHPLCDSQAGFVLASMEQGVRLTTGVELASPDAAPNPAQLREAERIARQYWPLGAAVEAEPWMGRRPCTPDMRPIIGPAPHHSGLWFNFGHAHHGLTLGPVSGRLLTEMMMGDIPFTDPTPYSAQRFISPRN
ncbi:NAD(P)/FAD-dependent oxidoreductase [Paenalcaligenes sp. Me131]|uniref:NAD(P)/FAD-dependent oxidoreductase n=1 Tax=Paenalcaligenes sp. Me131 TaxID=3392636 RepID=UPI003D2BD6EC